MISEKEKKRIKIMLWGFVVVVFLVAMIMKYSPESKPPERELALSELPYSQQVDRVAKEYETCMSKAVGYWCNPRTPENEKIVLECTRKLKSYEPDLGADAWAKYLKGVGHPYCP